MEKSARHISVSKFAGLSSRQQHKVLSSLAWTCNQSDDWLPFQEKYEQLMSVAEIDRYRPPDWLTHREAMEESQHFHLWMSGKGTNWALDPPPQLSWQPRFEVDVVLDQVRSPYNVGSIVRAIDAFGFRSLIHASDHFSADHAQFKRAAAGCEAWIPIHYEPQLVAYLNGCNVPVLALDTAAESTAIADWQVRVPCVLVLGNETYGIAEKVGQACDMMVHLPMFGFKHSMNVSQSLAVFATHLIQRSG